MWSRPCTSRAPSTSRTCRSVSPAGELPFDQMEIAGEEVQADEQAGRDAPSRSRDPQGAARAGGGLDGAARKAEYDRLWSAGGRQADRRDLIDIDEVEDKTADLAALHTATEAEIALLARYEPISKIQPLAKLVVTPARSSRSRFSSSAATRPRSRGSTRSSTAHEQPVRDHLARHRRGHDGRYRGLRRSTRSRPQVPGDGEREPGPPSRRFKDIPLTPRMTRSSSAVKTACRDRADQGFDELSAKWYLKLTAAARRPRRQARRDSAIPKFGRTEYAFMIVGWLPVEGSRPSDEDRGPLRQRGIVTSWRSTSTTSAKPRSCSTTPKAVARQSLLSIMGNPHTGHRPVVPARIFYPLFFGMIVGDIGYGAVMLAR